MSLKKKMINGIFWSLLEKGGQQGLSLIVFLVLARILGPQDYGLANICFIFFTLAAMITAGLVDAVISKQIDNEKQLSSLFWGVNAIGLGISLLCIISSIPLSILMNEPRLVDILLWFSIAPILISLYSLPNILLLKELDFKVYAIRTIFSTILGGIVGVYMAVNDFGAFAIVGQQLTIFFVNNLIVWQSINWRPKLLFNWDELKSTIKPGLSVLGTNVVGFVDVQMPRLFIASILGASALGYFALSTRLRYSISEVLIQSPLAVLYPALAKIKDDKDKQLELAKLAIYASNLIVFPIIAIGVATAPQYVKLLFGDSWLPAVPILQIYIGILLVLPTQYVLQQLFRVNNLMHFYLKRHLYFVIANVCMSLLLFLDNGLLLMSIGIFIISVISMPVFSRLLTHKTNLNLNKEIFELWVPLLAALATYFSIDFVYKNAELIENPWLLLTSCVLLGFFVFTAICMALNFNKIKNLYLKISKRNIYSNVQ